MANRHHLDGEPFYCTFCGSGFNEYGACEDVRCKLETKETAMKRKRKSSRKSSRDAGCQEHSEVLKSAGVHIEGDGGEHGEVLRACGIPGY